MDGEAREREIAKAKGWSHLVSKEREPERRERRREERRSGTWGRKG